MFTFDVIFLTHPSKHSSQCAALRADFFALSIGDNWLAEASSVLCTADSARTKKYLPTVLLNEGDHERGGEIKSKFVLLCSHFKEGYAKSRKGKLNVDHDGNEF